MRGLFLRIFVSFWLAMLAVLAGSFLVFQLSGPPPRWEQRRALFDDALRLQGELALQTLDAEGREASDAHLQSLAERTGITMVLLRDDEQVAGGDLEGLAELLVRLRASPQDERTRDREFNDSGRQNLILELATGTVVTTRARTSALDRFVGPNLWARILIVGIVAGLLALLLARYLTRPLARLRGAAQRMAEGDLDVQVAPQVQGATHEVEALAGDLDRMASRISGLLAAQRRLLQDVSHELRSPLARLNVALGLARQAPETVRHLDRIELESERLGDLIGQILTLSRLDEKLPRIEVVSLAELVDEIVRDADYEAKGVGRSVKLTRGDDAETSGNAEVLRWVVENVLRNAIRFAPEESTVEVQVLQSRDEVAVEIRDHGPGVPESELEAIFRPFYRVAPDRGRRTGGAGIGLAIAERGVRAHNGTIKATNAEGGGLCVTLTLPGLVSATRSAASPGVRD